MTPTQKLKVSMAALIAASMFLLAIALLMFNLYNVETVTFLQSFN